MNIDGSQSPTNSILHRDWYLAPFHCGRPVVLTFTAKLMSRCFGSRTLNWHPGKPLSLKPSDSVNISAHIQLSPLILSPIFALFFSMFPPYLLLDCCCYVITIIRFCVLSKFFFQKNAIIFHLFHNTLKSYTIKIQPQGNSYNTAINTRQSRQGTR